MVSLLCVSVKTTVQYARSLALHLPTLESLAIKLFLKRLLALMAITLPFTPPLSLWYSDIWETCIPPPGTVKGMLSTLLICALRVCTEIGEGWVKVWVKTLFGRFSLLVFLPAYIAKYWWLLRPFYLYHFMVPLRKSFTHDVFESVSHTVSIVCLQLCIRDISTLFFSLRFLFST